MVLLLTFLMGPFTCLHRHLQLLYHHAEKQQHQNVLWRSPQNPRLHNTVIAVNFVGIEKELVGPLVAICVLVPDFLQSSDWSTRVRVVLRPVDLACHCKSLLQLMSVMR